MENRKKTNCILKLKNSNYFFGSILMLTISSCSVSHQISGMANTILLKDTAISTGHIGISIYEPATGKYWYNYDATKYFIPASNTKLFTLYAGMRYLGDSLAGLRVTTYNKKIVIAGNGDPTFLHPDFLSQPVYDFLAQTKKPLWASDQGFNAEVYGSGWAWDDYNDSYMIERSSLPVFGNSVVFSGTKNNISYFPKGAVSLPRLSIHSKNGTTGYIDKVKRDRFSNSFVLNIDGKEKKNVVVPFITSSELAFTLLADTLHKTIISANTAPADESGEQFNKYIIRSRPSDSLFKPMMHNSDNFFAEQTLLMVSNERLGYMSDEAIIDTLLRTDLKDLPQKPKWVDGSGLSRYNLFTPQSFIYILNKLKSEFGWDRLRNILPTGGQGTLNSFFLKDSGFIYAKTGTLSNNCVLSGFLLTNKGKLLIFSILANQYMNGSTPIRKAIERFLEDIKEKY